jgi:hypothetical protein
VIGVSQKPSLGDDERSRFALRNNFYKLFKTAQAVGKALITFLKIFAHCIQILTTNNVKNFAEYEYIIFLL